jgi:serine/threonine protein phosphatase PrpC
MGGHAAGEVASKVAVEMIVRAFEGAPADVDLAGVMEKLLHAIWDANDVMLWAGRENQRQRGMGATIVALAFERGETPRDAVVAWIGDSRCYQLRAGRLEQLTADHTFIAYLLETGRLTPEGAARHPDRAALLLSLGERGGGHARPASSISRRVTSSFFARTASPTRGRERGRRHLLAQPLVDPRARGEPHSRCPGGGVTHALDPAGLAELWACVVSADDAAVARVQRRRRAS